MCPGQCFRTNGLCNDRPTWLAFSFLAQDKQSLAASISWVLSSPFEKESCLIDHRHDLLNCFQWLCKIFTKALLGRLEELPDSNQPRESAGFRSRSSTRDHLQVMKKSQGRLLSEKCHCIHRLLWTLKSPLTPWK